MNVDDLAGALQRPRLCFSCGLERGSGETCAHCQTKRVTATGALFALTGGPIVGNHGEMAEPRRHKLILLAECVAEERRPLWIYAVELISKPEPRFPRCGIIRLDAGFHDAGAEPIGVSLWSSTRDAFVEVCRQPSPMDGLKAGSAVHWSARFPTAIPQG